MCNLGLTSPNAHARTQCVINYLPNNNHSATMSIDVRARAQERASALFITYVCAHTSHMLTYALLCWCTWCEPVERAMCVRVHAINHLSGGRFFVSFSFLLFIFCIWKMSAFLCVGPSADFDTEGTRTR